MDFLVGIPILLLIALAVLLFVRMAKYGGTKGALFKSRITRTVGTINVINTPRGLEITVHSLQRQDPGWVGIEFALDNGESWQITPLTLSKNEAIQLSKLLTEAADPA